MNDKIDKMEEDSWVENAKARQDELIDTAIAMNGKEFLESMKFTNFTDEIPIEKVKFEDSSLKELDFEEKKNYKSFIDSKSQKVYTCSPEQRKFLDVIERKGRFNKTNFAIEVGEDGDSLMLGSDFYILDVGKNQKDYVNLSKVIKGD